MFIVTSVPMPDQCGLAATWHLTKGALLPPLSPCTGEDVVDDRRALTEPPCGSPDRWDNRVPEEHTDPIADTDAHTQPGGARCIGPPNCTCGCKALVDAPPTAERPCVHNEWDDVRTRKNSKILRCRVCQRKWKLPSAGVPRCQEFLRGECDLGEHCQRLHVFKKKIGVEERAERFGPGVLLAQVQGGRRPPALQSAEKDERSNASQSTPQAADGSGRSDTARPGVALRRFLSARDASSSPRTEPVACSPTAHAVLNHHNLTVCTARSPGANALPGGSVPPSPSLGSPPALQSAPATSCCASRGHPCPGQGWGSPGLAVSMRSPIRTVHVDESDEGSPRSDATRPVELAGYHHRGAIIPDGSPAHLCSPVDISASPTHLTGSPGRRRPAMLSLPEELHGSLLTPPAAEPWGAPLLGGSPSEAVLGGALSPGLGPRQGTNISTCGSLAGGSAASPGSRRRGLHVRRDSTGSDVYITVGQDGTSCLEQAEDDAPLAMTEKQLDEHMHRLGLGPPVGATACPAPAP